MVLKNMENLCGNLKKCLNIMLMVQKKYGKLLQENRVFENLAKYKIPKEKNGGAVFEIFEGE